MRSTMLWKYKHYYVETNKNAVLYNRERCGKKRKKLYIGTENIAQHRKRMLCGKLKKLRGSNTYEVQHSFFFLYIYLFSMYIYLEKT